MCQSSVWMRLSVWMRHDLQDIYERQKKVLLEISCSVSSNVPKADLAKAGRIVLNMAYCTALERRTRTYLFCIIYLFYFKKDKDKHA